MALRSFRPFFHNLEHSHYAPAAASSPSLWQPPQSLFDHFASSSSYPAVSIEETTNGYEITAEVPGIKKDEIKVSLGDQNRRLILEGNMVRKESPFRSIKDANNTAATSSEGAHDGAVAQKDEEKELATKQNQRNFLVDERVFRQTFHRAFHFATPLDPKSMKAKLDEGVLKLTVDKQAQDSGVSVIKIE